MQLRKNQENKSYIFLGANNAETLFSDELPELQVSVTDNRQKSFIERKSPNAESLIDLYYGYPVFKDEKDMLSPLFFVEVEIAYGRGNDLSLLPQIKSFSINRNHFINQYGREEMERICAELEGEFGSFDARMKAAAKYIPSLADKNFRNWIKQPMLFRTNYSGSRSGLRYDLTHLLKEKDSHSKNTALKWFLEGFDNAQPVNKTKPVLLEVGALNAQQEEAVIKGLSEPLSVVTGPPGTGKTQVVTALLASAVYAKDTVLFASNNNMPVDGVYERLGQSCGKIGNWLLRLGNQAKRQAGQAQISTILDRANAKDLSGALIYTETKQLSELDREIEAARASLDKALVVQGQISNLHNQEKVIEQKLPEDWVQQFSNTDPMPLDAATLKKLRVHSEQTIWLWLRKKLFGGGKFIDRHNALLESLCAEKDCFSNYDRWLLEDEEWTQAVQQSREAAKVLWRHQNWANAIKKRRQLEAKITDYATIAEVKNLKDKKSEVSQTLFAKWWLNNIRHDVNNALEAFKAYFKDIDDFSGGRHRRLAKSIKALARYFPVWITTNQSASAIMPPEDNLFNLVVIDEAGQCDIPSIIPLLYRAKRAVIIGDPHQFKHITSLKDDIEHAIATEAGIEEIIDDWSFTRRSAFDRSFASATATSFLKQHYRCHPDIIEFSNLNFYDGKLVKQVALSRFQNQLPIEEQGLIWHNTIGKAQKGKTGAWNPTEIEKTASIFDAWAEQGLFTHPELTYGVVTPFRKQVEEMRKVISRRPWYKGVEERFTIGTAHSFQGSECDVLIYSPVVADGMEDYLVKFAAAQEDLINVTVTRAKNLLYIVGDLEACQSASTDTPLYQLAAYAERLRKQQQNPMNTAEQAMAEILDELGLSYAAQYELASYRLDFLLNAPSGETYDIEVDGDIHLTAEAIQHDDRRDAFVTSKDIKILRFSARDVINKPELIRERLTRI